MEKGLDIASVIAGKSPVAVQGTKTLLDYSRDHTVREGILMAFTVDDRVGVYTVMELNLFADGRISSSMTLMVGFKGSDWVIL